jgi:hypothetical protein
VGAFPDDAALELTEDTSIEHGFTCGSIREL